MSNYKYRQALRKRFVGRLLRKFGMSKKKSERLCRFIP